MTNNNESSLGEWFQNLMPYKWHFRLAIITGVFFVVLCLVAAAKHVEFFIHIFKINSVPSEMSAQLATDPTAKPAISFTSAKNLFGRVQVKQEAAVAPADLQLNGIIMSDDPDDRAAIIAEKGKPEEIYRLNDQIPGGATLKEVHTDYAIISRNGATEKLILNLEAKGLPDVRTPTRSRRRTRTSPRAIPVQQRQEIDYKRYQGTDAKQFGLEGAESSRQQRIEQLRSRSIRPQATDK